MLAKYQLLRNYNGDKAFFERKWELIANINNPSMKWINISGSNILLEIIRISR